MLPHRPPEREQLDLFHALPGDLAPRDARSLCGKALEWLEVVS